MSRFGSKANIAECETDVRFTLKSGHSGRFSILLLVGKSAKFVEHRP
jgi:hypothetical protein